MSANRTFCAVCGCTLPNRYAIAGHCGSPGCEAVFCALHWHTGNGLCPEHGWKENPPVSQERDGEVSEKKEQEEKMAEEQQQVSPTAETELRTRAERELSSESRKKITKSLLDFTVSLGKSAGALFDRLRGVRDPEAALVSLDAQLSATRSRREPMSARFEELYNQIAAKKKVWQSAPSARKKILEMELKALLAEYQSLERQLTILFENERIISTVRGRTLELIARGLERPRVEDVDRLTDDVENAATETDDLVDAVADLEKAGQRRTRQTDSVDLESALAGFDEMPPQTVEGEPVTEPPLSE